jgi:hypothetical protein
MPDFATTWTPPVVEDRVARERRLALEAYQRRREARTARVNRYRGLLTDMTLQELEVMQQDLLDPDGIARAGLDFFGRPTTIQGALHQAIQEAIDTARGR